MTVSRPDTADAVPEIDAIHAARPLYGAMMHGEYHAVPLAQRHNDRPRLHTRSRLGHDEFTAVGRHGCRPRPDS